MKRDGQFAITEYDQTTDQAADLAHLAFDR